MKLALKFIDNNPHPKCGVFIKHASPKVWLEEIKRMELRLSDCTAYACPGLEANSISGILLILKTAQKNVDIGNVISVQKVHEGFYIPENTTLNMALTDDEFSSILNGIPHFFHHEFGLIELKEILDWSTIIQNPTEVFPVIETPAKGVKIPTKVNAFSIEIEAEEEAEALGNPFGKEEVDLKELPFDMKKVLNGNNDEVAKYLDYLDRNPEAALKMAIPLDMMGTSRGKAFAKYKFESNFFESIGFGNFSGNGKKSIKVLFGILAIIVLFWVSYEAVQMLNETAPEVEVVNTSSTETPTNNDEFLADESLVDGADIDTSSSGSKSQQESIRPQPENNIIESVLLIATLLAFLILIIYVVKKNKDKRRKIENQQKTSWIDLPDESELFDLDEAEKTKTTSAFYFGGDELSTLGKVIIFLILLGLICYLFYPVINSEGFSIIFGILAAIIVLRMLFTLLNRNKKFNDDD